MTPLLQVCWVAAVTLGLYAIYCFWEAGRADLASSFRHLMPNHSGAPGLGGGGSAYRARAWLAGASAVLLALVCLAAAL